MIISLKMAEEAAAVLQVGLPDITADVVKVAYRARAQMTHPDAGGSAEAFAEVDRAKHVLLEWLRRRENEPTPSATFKPRKVCHMCDGKGFVTSQRAWRALRVSCGACRGTGDLDTEHDDGDGR